MTHLSPEQRLRAAADTVRTHTATAHPSPDSLWCPEVANALATWLDGEAALIESMGAMAAMLSASLQIPAGQGPDVTDVRDADQYDVSSSSRRALELADTILAVPLEPATPTGWVRRWGLRLDGDDWVAERGGDGRALYTEEQARTRAAQRLDHPQVVTRLVPPWTPAPAPRR